MLSLAVLSSISSIVSPGGNVLVVGTGPVCFCAAKLAALRGFSTTALMYPQEIEMAPGLIYDKTTAEGSIPLSFVPIAGPDVSEADIEAVASKAEGIILAIDGEKTFGGPLLETFIKPEGALKRVSVMSRYLNGEGMGFFAKSAKLAANKDVWAGDAKAVGMYKDMEAGVQSQAAAAGATYTVIRAGTLKGGASASSNTPEGGAGEPTLLTPEFYKLGQQDVANWRLIYDVDALGVKLVAGDTLPGPGATAVFTATDKCGAGDSHRGAVAACLVEALRSEAAADRDFSVAAVEGTEFPSEEAFARLFSEA